MFAKVSSEDEEKIIDSVARKIVEKGMEVPSVLFLDMFKPMAYVSSAVGQVTLFPILYLMGDSGFKFLKVFEKIENIERLLKRIEELVEQEKKDDAKQNTS